MSLPRFTHLALHVTDLSACADFYQNFCQLSIAHHRTSSHQQVMWLADSLDDPAFVLVLMDGGYDHRSATDDYRHFGFALASKAEVDAIAERADKQGCLLWPPRQDPFPAGYYCGVRDPNGNAVEFSYGQPLGPGAPPLSTL